MFLKTIIANGFPAGREQLHNSRLSTYRSKILVHILTEVSRGYSRERSDNEMTETRIRRALTQ